jgi:hypothetical protein
MVVLIKDSLTISQIVKGVGKLHSFGAYKALRIGIGHWTIGGLNFEFLLNFVLLFMMMVAWGLPKSGSFGKVEYIRKHLFGVRIKM